MYILLALARTTVIMMILIVSVTNMHTKMVTSICRSKILFFDSNPIGRVYTRFSKDVTVVDLVLPSMLSMVTFALFRTLTVSMVVITIYPEMIVVVILVALMMYIVLKKAIAA